jgi:hypothetical protein
MHIDLDGQQVRFFFLLFIFFFPFEKLSEIASFLKLLLFLGGDDYLHGERGIAWSSLHEQIGTYFLFFGGFFRWTDVGSNKIYTVFFSISFLVGRTFTRSRSYVPLSSVIFSFFSFFLLREKDTATPLLNFSFLFRPPSIAHLRLIAIKHLS